jgi:hypothetical protein
MVCGIGAVAACVWAKVKVVGELRTLWLGAHLASAQLLSISPRGLVILDVSWELRVTGWFGL